MGPVQYVRQTHAVPQQSNLVGLVKRLAGSVPDFENVEPFLGADGDADNRVGRVERRDLQNRRRRVPLKRLGRRRLGHLDAVRTAANVAAVLPQRHRGPPHQEEHARKKLVDANPIQGSPEPRKVGEGAQFLVGRRGPVRVLWIVKVKGPRARREDVGRPGGRSGSRGHAR